MRRADWFALGLVLCIAAALRLGWLGVNPFALDEALISQPALRMAREGWLAPFGTVSSVGVPFLPLGTWLFAIPYLFTRDPLVVTAAVGVVNVAAVAGLWLVMRRRFGGTAALAGGLFLAAAPYAVMYSRGIWQPDLLIPLAVAWLVLVDAVLRKPSAWRLGVLAFLSMATFQVHFAGAALTLATGYLGLRMGWWRRPLPLMVGAAVAALGAVPYLAEIICCQVSTVDTLGETVKSDLLIDGASLQNAFSLILGRGWETTALGERDVNGYGQALVPALMAASLVLAGILVATRLWRTGENRIFLEGVLAALVMPVLLFLVHTSPVNPYYELPVIVMAAVFAGLAVQMFPARGWRRGVVMYAAALAAIWGTLLGLSLDLAGRINAPNGLSIPLRASRDAAYGLQEDVPVILHTTGGDTGVDGHAAIFRVFWWDRPQNRIVTGDSLLLLPDKPVYLLAELPSIQAWEEIIAADIASEQGSFPRREGEPTQPWAYYDGETLPTGFTPVSPPVIFADGTQLEGWRVRWVGQRLRVSTLWRLASPARASAIESAVHQFHHLYAADADEPVAVSDVPIALEHWQAGDRAIVAADFYPEFEGEVTLVLGHYTPQDMTRLPLATDDADYVLVGIFDTRDIAR